MPSLCDNILAPSLLSYLIYDNGASLKGKGITFSRQRFEEHLHKYYRLYGNDGYILLMDYSKFYDNIPHDIAYQEIAKHVHDEFSLWLLDLIFDNFKIDVSYMTDEEYEHCMETPFNSADYRLNVPKSAHTGEKFMRKSVNIGDQCSQIIGIYYPTQIDNFVKIVEGQKFYGRYMDDSYVISQSKEYLIELEAKIAAKATELGMTLNRKKTAAASSGSIFAIASPTLPKDNCSATNTSDKDFIPPMSLVTDNRHVGYFMVKLNKIYGRYIYGFDKMSRVRTRCV